MENELKGQLGEVRMTIHVTRKETGLTETHQLIGTVLRETEEPQESDDGGHPLNRSS